VDASVVSQLRAALSAESDVQLAVLFGSRAKGRQAPDSDVDLAVRAPGLDVLDLARRLSLALGFEVDLVDLDAAGYPMLRELVETGVLVAERSPGSAARWRAHALAALETDLPWYRRMRDAYLAHAARGTRRW
jgi:predicted nucleotidyltransferase